MGLPREQVLQTAGVSEASTKLPAKNILCGSAGHGALRVARLIGKATEIGEMSTAADAPELDAAKWLGEWLHVQQPALGGLMPASLLDTPTGFWVVMRLLGATHSGAYQWTAPCSCQIGQRPE